MVTDEDNNFSSSDEKTASDSSIAQALKTENEDLKKAMKLCQEKADKKLLVADDALNKFEQMETLLEEEEKEVERLSKEKDELASNLEKMERLNFEIKKENYDLKEKLAALKTNNDVCIVGL